MLYVFYLLTVVVLISADQFTKYLIVRNIKDTSNSIILIKDFFNITYVKNYGAGFSILQNQTTFLIIIGCLTVFGLTYLLINSKKHETLNKISYLLIIGGSIGNMLDRFRFGYVIDFLDFYIFKYNFPVFNIADCFITIGCFIIIISIILETKNVKN